MGLKSEGRVLVVCSVHRMNRTRSRSSGGRKEGGREEGRAAGGID